MLHKLSKGLFEVTLLFLRKLFCILFGERCVDVRQLTTSISMQWSCPWACLMVHYVLPQLLLENHWYLFNYASCFYCVVWPHFVIISIGSWQELRTSSFRFQSACYSSWVAAAVPGPWGSREIQRYSFNEMLGESAQPLTGERSL